jgi:regulator of sirC expression with transglutaminase-like and TPR domain
MELQEPPREAFAELAARLAAGDERVPLDRAALLVAAEFQPRVDVAGALGRLDALAEQAAPVLHTTADDAERVDRFVDHLHGTQGFRGDEDHYEDPRNSYLDRVLVRRRGIPITLSILYVEVARRLALPLHGVSFPRHFLVRHGGSPGLLIDPFFGCILDDAECELRWHRAMGPDVPLDRDALRPASVCDVLVRMLGNLKRCFVSSREFVRAASCCDRLLLLRPDHPDELRDRGLLYEHLECYGAAARDLERFLALAPDDPGADTVRRRLERLRRPRAAIH